MQTMRDLPLRYVVDGSSFIGCVGAWVGKNKGRGHFRRLVDKGVLPASSTYQPPAAHVCDETVFPVEMSPTDQFVVRQRIYKGKVVDFAVMQQTRVSPDDPWREVARIDCCHGRIHRHRFACDDPSVDDNVTLADIPAQGGWEFVDSHYDETSRVLFDSWEDELWRWRNGG